MKKMFTLFVFILMLCTMPLNAYANNFMHVGRTEISETRIKRFQIISRAFAIYGSTARASQKLVQI